MALMNVCFDFDDFERFPWDERLSNSDCFEETLVNSFKWDFSEYFSTTVMIIMMVMTKTMSNTRREEEFFFWESSAAKVWIERYDCGSLDSCDTRWTEYKGDSELEVIISVRRSARYYSALVFFQRCLKSFCWVFGYCCEQSFLMHSVLKLSKMSKV